MKYHSGIGIITDELSLGNKLAIIRNRIDGKDDFSEYYGKLNGDDGEVIMYYKDFCCMMSKNQQDFFQKLFNIIYSSEYPKKLYDIDSIKTIKKEQKEKYGFLGKKIRYVEYEEENPKYIPLKNIIEKEPYIVIFNETYHDETQRGIFTVEEWERRNIIFTKSCKFYRIDYMFEESYGDTFNGKSIYNVGYTEIHPPIELENVEDVVIFNLIIALPCGDRRELFASK